MRSWAVLLPCALLLSLPAEAQQARRRSAPGSGTDIRQSLSDALSPPEDPGGGVGIGPSTPAPGLPEAPLVPRFSFDLLLPLVINTNPAQAPGGTTPSLEATPEMRLSWVRRFPAVPVLFSAVLDTSTDRFARAAAANTGDAFGRFRAQYESGTDDQEWQPFGSVVPTWSFSPDFGTRTTYWTDYNLGLSKLFSFDRFGRRVPPGAETDTSAEVTFGINASVQRRIEQDGFDASSTALLVNPSVTLTLAERWSASLEVDLTWRRYDALEGARRRDLLATPVLTLEYTLGDGEAPSRLGKPVVNLQVFFSRQTSSLPDFGFSQFGAGPVLRTGWRF